MVLLDYLYCLFNRCGADKCGHDVRSDPELWTLINPNLYNPYKSEKPITHKIYMNETNIKSNSKNIYGSYD